MLFVPKQPNSIFWGFFKLEKFKIIFVIIFDQDRLKLNKSDGLVIFSSSLGISDYSFQFLNMSRLIYLFS